MVNQFLMRTGWTYELPILLFLGAQGRYDGRNDVVPSIGYEVRILIRVLILSFTDCVPGREYDRVYD
jgi:hypothetical protein